MISGLSVKAGLKPCITARKFVRGSPQRNHVVKPVQYKERDDAERFKQDTSRAFDDARDRAEGAKDRAVNKGKEYSDKTRARAEEFGDNARAKANEFGDRAREKADETRQTAEEELDRSGASGVGYLTGAIAWVGLIGYQLLRPESTLAIFFRHTLSAAGAELAALSGAMSSSAFLMQAFAVLGFPIATALFCQAHAARGDRLDSDSSMRLNFGLALQAVWLLAANAASPLWQNFGALAVTGVAGYILFTGYITLQGVKDSRKFESSSETVISTIKGFFATVLRTLTPRSLGGAVYGILATVSALAALSTVFNPNYVTGFFGSNAAEAAYQAAKGDLVAVLTRSVGGQLAFVAVAFAALKELADKNALAATTARFLNWGMTITAAGFALLLNWGRQHNIASSQGAGWFGLGTQVSAFVVLASIYFAIYPGSRSEVQQDTGAECYY